MRLKPSRSFHEAFSAERAASTLAKSTSTTLNAWGLTDLLITMWSPVSLRILDSFTVEVGDVTLVGSLESMSTN